MSQPTTPTERPTMPTLTAPVTAWYQCHVCLTELCKSRPTAPETALDKALRHVADVHHIQYPDSLSMVTEHRPKS